MSKHYTFFDVETPNRKNDRICQIAAIRTDNQGNIEYQQGFLVDPDSGFDDTNSAIHGIFHCHVVGAPTFDKLWLDELQDVFNDTTLVAHNASFDMNVLYKTASYHDLKLPSLSYLCTNRLAQSYYPTLSDFGLKTVCKHLDIPLEQHHSAIADAYACEQIFGKTMNWHNLNNLQEALFVASAIKMSKPESRSLAQAMTDLYGIIIGIGMDGIFTPSELPAIHDWMMRNQSHKNEALFHDVFLTLSEILNNNNLTKNEADKLLNIIRPFLNTGVNNSETIATQELLGIISGISADRIVNNTEAKELNNWLVEHDKLKDNPIAARIIKMVKRALADNYIDSDEEAELLLLFDKTLNPMEEDGSLSCVGKKFCLSGDFTHGKKSDIEADIISRGGECVSGVTKKCDYVVVGGFGSEQYAFGKYGTKVKKAMTLQDAGHPIKVIQEAELFV